MKNRIISIISIIAMIVILVGCSKATKKVLKEGAVDFYNKYTREEIKDENNKLILYVEINEPVFGRDEKYNYAKNYIENEYQNFMKTVKEETVPIAKQNLEFMPNDTNEESREFKVTRRYEIIENNNDIISIIFSDSQYTGGAHGSTLEKAVVLDLKNNKQIELADLFNTDEETYSKVLHDKVCKIIEENKVPSNKDVNEVAKREINYFDEYESAVSSSFNTDSYYIDRDKIVFLYGEYSIAPYSEGVQRIEIELRDIKDILKPNFALDIDNNK